MIVIGVDPGTIRTGWAVLRRDGNRIARLGSGTILLDDSVEVEDRLLPLEAALDGLLTTYGPDEAAVESLFFAKNATSALKLGHARGVILLTLRRRGIRVTSYPPALVKRSVVGGGRAAKGQVQQIVRTILKLPDTPAEDEADALAIALCHANAPRVPLL